METPRIEPVAAGWEAGMLCSPLATQTLPNKKGCWLRGALEPEILKSLDPNRALKKTQQLLGHKSPSRFKIRLFTECAPAWHRTQQKFISKYATETFYQNDWTLKTGWRKKNFFKKVEQKLSRKLNNLSPAKVSLEIEPWAVSAENKMASMEEIKKVSMADVNVAEREISGWRQQTNDSTI